MWGRIAAIAAAAALAACANMTPAGRNAERAPPPPTAAEAPQPPTSMEVQPQTAAPPVAAPEVSAPPPAQARRSNGNEIVVPGAVETQVPPPGDPRTSAQRMEDIRRWDRCVMQVQSSFESDPMRPQLESPEEYCRQTLGMEDRLAVPVSRLERR